MAASEPQTLDEARTQNRELRAQLDQLADFLEHGALGLHWVDAKGKLLNEFLFARGAA